MNRLMYAICHTANRRRDNAPFSAIIYETPSIWIIEERFFSSFCAALIVCSKIYPSGPSVESMHSFRQIIYENPMTTDHHHHNTTHKLLQIINGKNRHHLDCVDIVLRFSFGYAQFVRIDRDHGRFGQQSKLAQWPSLWNERVMHCSPRPQYPFFPAYYE